MNTSTPIVIYQMGKVGSTAIYNALSPIFKNVYQVHSLVPIKLEKTTRILNEKGLGIPKHVNDSKFIIDNYLNKGLPIKIITPIRSPLQRNMSAFFQELSTEIILKDELRNGLGVHSIIKQIKLIPAPNEWKNLLIQKLIQPNLIEHIDFLIEYFTHSYRHRIPLDWFDVEFKEATKFDVFKEEFFHEKGHQEYIHDSMSILIYKAELDNSIKSEIIRNYLGNDSIKIKSIHKSTSKSYGKAYEQFKTKIQTNEALLSPYLSSGYVKKFYPGSHTD